MSEAGKPLQAGWYMNPEVGGQQYWDGEKWLSIPSPSGASVPSPQVSQGQTSTLAVVALIFSFLIPIVGFILGFSAKKEIENSNGQKTGRGMATASIWLGAIGTIGIVIYVVLIVIGTGNSSNVSDSSILDSCSQAAAQLYGYTCP